jgi:hypothetical protein
MLFQVILIFVLCLPYQLNFSLFSVYREHAKNKRGSPAGGTSRSLAPARNKNSSGVQRSKGKEHMTTDARKDGAEGEPNASTLLPNVLNVLSLETRSCV